MKENMKIRGQLRTYLQWPIILSVFLLAANLAVGIVSPAAGLVMSGFTVIYVLIIYDYLIILYTLAVHIPEKTSDGRTGGVFGGVCVGAETAPL